VGKPRREGASAQEKAAPAANCKKGERNIMKLGTLALLSVLTLGIQNASAADGVLNVGTEGEYPPWSIADANGAVTGFDADTANLICDKLQMKCSFVVQAFDGLIPALQAKRFDIIISGMSRTKERMKTIDFSIGYAELPNMFVVAKGSDLTKSTTIPDMLKSLEGKKVGVQAATTHANFMTKMVPGADLKTYDSLDKLQIDLAAGRLDAGFADSSALDDFLGKPDGANFELVPVVIPSATDDTLGMGVGVGIRKENADLKAKIDQALCDVIKDGSLGEASKKWFKRDITIACK
jgi:octopine/nopaline transport system substrate-binding protein